MEQLTAFFKGVLDGLQGWSVKQLMFLIPAMGGIIAAVQFGRSLFKAITKRPEPQWALMLSPLVAGIGYMLAYPEIIRLTMGEEVRRSSWVEVVLLGIGLGMVNSVVYKYGKKAWRAWRKKKS